MKIIHSRQFEIDALDQFVYRGEGNSSIVIALRDRGQVIKLLKGTSEKHQDVDQLEHLVQSPLENIKFIDHVFRPLIEPYLNSGVHLVHLKSYSIEGLSKKIQAHRPTHRLDKVLIIDDQYAIVMDDLCALPPRLTKIIRSNSLCGPTISVEIKPKQGFLPVNQIIKNRNSNCCERFGFGLENNCLYGLTQYLKLAQGRTSQISGYCPVNLFSGCPIRMKDAIGQLLIHPQNNLRIFKNLSQVYDEGSDVKLASIIEELFDSDLVGLSSNDLFIDLLIRCLLDVHEEKPINSCNQTADTARDENSFKNCDNCLKHKPMVICKHCDTNWSSKRRKSDHQHGHKLPESCVLDRVLRAQKLDSVGAYRASQMLTWLLENETDVDILSELSVAKKPPGFGSLDQLPFETKQQYYFRKVYEFLVSMTAKDCSIIVTIRRLAPGCHEAIAVNQPQLRRHLLRDPTTGISYFFSIGVTDLDQKKPLRIPRLCDNIKLMYDIRNDETRNE